MTLTFNRSFDPTHGTPVEIAPGIRRLTAPNPGAYTFHGTNTYLVGTDRLVIIDPGPDDPAHLAAILHAAAGASVTHILVTHTHRDHSPAARPLAAATNASILGAAPHVFARPLHLGETNPLDAAADLDHRPDQPLADGETLAAPAGRFIAVATPGHAANHLAFALEGSGHLFSGDHVMAWSTSIVAPPDGSMADYMASLDRVAARPESIYLPGHGGPVHDAASFVEGLKAHRHAREAAVLAALARGARTIPEIVRDVYTDVDPKLWPAAGLSVFAQLEWLVQKGRVATPDDPRLDGRYEIAGPLSPPAAS
jgi:glyoxylase-like metal-dependent hydrolase (beta-lactamase superfamily II)